jgi:hypothetical protein
MLPEPVADKLAPEPTTPVKVVLVPLVRLAKGVAEPEPQVAPVPEITPEELACKHCVVPVVAMLVKELKVPAFGVVPPMGGGDA